ncbi:hypothetical protein HJC23_010272 [Cyclotella cryptica]|uniref:Uncharacterized protein n=1 Tax=Cyclotella cryptica TaxID=29204 RepID=A0ABD3QP84_9STRA|eukprot:CCRYP_003662-RA/>CCRYP_003662-RA protein AED:0.20 eAED:0.20 QI:0/-1/0/1/-1/1/1/0/203
MLDKAQKRINTNHEIKGSSKQNCTYTNACRSSMSRIVCLLFAISCGLVIICPINAFVQYNSVLSIATAKPYPTVKQHRMVNDEEGTIPDEKSQEYVYIPELSWRVAKLRLEEANTKQILKRKPLKLPYKTSRRWIQANWAPKTKEEFYDLVANGNLRTPYISKRPEEYYGARGEWISWEHYLLGSDEEDEKNNTGTRQISKWE